MAIIVKTQGSAVWIVLLLLAISSTSVAVRLHQERQAFTTSLLNLERMELQVQLGALFAQAAAAIESNASWPPLWHRNDGISVEVEKTETPCEQFDSLTIENESEGEDYRCTRIDINAVSESGARLSRSRVLVIGNLCGIFWLA